MNITNSIPNFGLNYYNNGLPKSSHSKSAAPTSLFELEEDAAIKARQKPKPDEKSAASAVPNSKTPAINQNANGEAIITQEQIDFLKSKYDIENMSGSDYRNLMADLTQMNVISTKDAEGQFCRKMTAMAAYPAYEEPAPYRFRNTGDRVDCSMFVGNVLQNLKYEFNVASHKLSMAEKNRVSVNSASQLLEFRDTAENEKDMFGRIIDVLELIKK